MEKLKIEINKLQQTLMNRASEYTHDELTRMRETLDRLVSLKINWVNFKAVPVDPYENTLMAAFTPKKHSLTHVPDAFDTKFEAGTETSQVENWFETVYGAEIWTMLL